MFQQLLTIAGNTFTESIRQPIFTVLILVGALAMVMNQQLAAYTFTDDNKLLIDMALSTVFLIGLLLAAFTATGVLSSEIENRTVLSVVSKPVSRPLFVAGKYLGVAGAIAVAVHVLSVFAMFAIRHRVMTRASDHIDQPVVVFGLLAVGIALGLAAWSNYLFRRVFTSVFVMGLFVSCTVAMVLVLLVSKNWEIQSPWTDLMANDKQLWQIYIGLLLIFEAILILTAVAVAASTRLGQIMTLLLCVGVFFVGLVSNSLSQWTSQALGVESQIGPFASFAAIWSADIPWHLQLVCGLAQLTYLLSPNLQFLWPADAITQGNPFGWSYVVTATAYTGLYITVVLSLAVLLFQRREVG